MTLSGLGLVHDAAWYLHEHGGDVAYFHRYRREGQRLGQAFFNALVESDQCRIVEADYNVFYDDAALPAVLRLLEGG